MKNLIFVIAALSLNACAIKQKILDAPAVSMTHTHVPEGKRLEEKGAVTGNFCTSRDDKGTVGLMDETVKNAQKSANVDFILNASFFQEGRCMTVEGTGAVIR